MRDIGGWISGRRRATALLVVLVAACGGSTSVVEPTPKGSATVPGTVTRDAGGWTEYTIGDAPLIVAAPHGGLLTPTAIPDRNCSGCVYATDDNTQELARAIVTKFLARTGKRPHLIVNLLKRSKLDANRAVGEATDDNPQTADAWNFYHQSIDAAAASVAAAHGRGLLLDIHGHGHAINRVELGYNISTASLQLSDQALGAASSVFAASSFAKLISASAAHPTNVALLRGATSMGALFAARSIPAVPSPAIPAPATGDEYFDGGYTVERHGSSTGGAVDAIQIESYRPGLRDNLVNVDTYATTLVNIALDFLKQHYGWGSGSAQLAVAAALAPWTARGATPAMRLTWRPIDGDARPSLRSSVEAR